MKNGTLRTFILLLASSLACLPARALTDLPRGFAGIAVGAQWADIESQFDFQDLAPPTTPWDEHVAQCGYRSVLLDTDNGELLLTVNDFVVTDISYTTPIKPDSDLLAVADLVMQSYGQPDSASMRSVTGDVTIDKDKVNFITLAYNRANGVVFAISGRELWQYQISVRLERYRWHENKTLRCARQVAAQAKQEQAANPGAEDSNEPGAPAPE